MTQLREDEQPAVVDNTNSLSSSNNTYSLSRFRIFKNKTDAAEGIRTAGCRLRSHELSDLLQQHSGGERVEGWACLARASSAFCVSFGTFVPSKQVN